MQTLKLRHVSTYGVLMIRFTLKLPLKILLHCGDLYSTSTVVDLPTL